MRLRLAPNESRMPISRWRALARASITFETLAHAAASTRPNAANTGDSAASKSNVSGFGVAMGDASGVRTTVTISEIDGRAVPSDGTRTGVLLRFLSDLQGDLATESIDATNDGITASFAPDPDLLPSG